MKDIFYITFLFLSLQSFGQSSDSVSIKHFTIDHNGKILLSFEHYNDFAVHYAISEFENGVWKKIGGGGAEPVVIPAIKSNLRVIYKDSVVVKLSPLLTKIKLEFLDQKKIAPIIIHVKTK